MKQGSLKREWMHDCRRFGIGGRFCALMVMAGLALFFSPVVLAAFGQGQATTARLVGSISDPSGAVIPRATVTLTSTQKAISRSQLTDRSGDYSFPLLEPSSYTLTVTVKGFKTFAQSGISLDAGQSARQDVTLSVGSEAEKVEVTSQAPLLNADNANISADINSRQIVQLPLNLRNIISLATLNSSVNNTSQSQVLNGGSGSTNGNADQDISFLNFGGGFFGTTAFLLDGIWDTAPDWGGVIYVPSVDSVEEFRVQNNSFTAQYGWSTGNVINVVTKSGTSKFHGSAYEFYRNSAMDANLYFANYNGQPKPSFTRNQAGIAAGGPLYIPGLYEQRDKSFIFGLFEHLHTSTPSVATNTVPTQAFLAGDYSALLGAQEGTDALGRPIYSGQIYDPNSARLITNGTTDPKTGLVATVPGGGSAYIRDPIPRNNVAAYTTINKAGQAYLSYYPKPTNGNLSNNYAASGTAPSDSDEYLIRVDHSFTNATRIFGRYSYKSEYKTGTPDYWGTTNPAGPGNLRPNNRYNITLGLTHIFTPTLTMNATIGGSHWGETSTNQSLGFKPSTLGLPAYLDTNSPEFPIVNIGSLTSLGPTGGSENVYLHADPTASTSADIIKLLGRHTLSLGFMGIDFYQNQSGIFQTTLNSSGTFTQGPNPDTPAPNTGNGAAQAQFGVLDGGTTGTEFNPATKKTYTGYYVQDDWKVTHNLTLNLGMRYEVQYAATYRHDTAAYFDPKVPNPIGTAIGQTLPGALVFVTPSHRGIYNTNYMNWAPRVGFSGQVTPKLVMRGGFGIFFPGTLPTGSTATDGFSTSTNVVSAVSGSRLPNPAVSLSNPWPQGLRPITGNSLGLLQDVGYYVGSNYLNRNSPYVQQWMLGFQYGFTANDVLDVNYVGNHGTHLPLGGFNPSQLNPAYLSLGANKLNNAVANPFYGHIAAGQSSCSLDQPTIAASQLLHPYPQFCGVSENVAPLGFSLYDALQVNYNHRFSHGLNVLVSYTFSKFLDNTQGTASWAYVGNSAPANNYNLAAEKSVDAGDIPHSLVVNYIYQLPVGRGQHFGSGMNRATNAALGGWQVSGITSVKSGIPLGIQGSNINSYGGAPRPDVVGPLHLAHPNIHEWFNTGAFAFAPYGTFGTAPRYFSTLRSPYYQNWDIGIMKNWGLWKESNLQFRAEMFNAFNHPNFYSPNVSYGGCDPNASPGCKSTFGQITATFPARDVQLAMKYTW